MMQSTLNTLIILILLIVIPYLFGFLGNKIFRLVNKGDVTNMWYSGLMYLSFIGLGLLFLLSLIRIVFDIKL